MLRCYALILCCYPSTLVRDSIMLQYDITYLHQPLNENLWLHPHCRSASGKWWESDFSFVVYEISIVVYKKFGYYEEKKNVIYQGKYSPLLVSLVTTNTIKSEIKYGLSTEYQFVQTTLITNLAALHIMVNLCWLWRNVLEYRTVFYCGKSLIRLC